MRLRFKIILPTLIIFSLIGFVGESNNSSLNVRYYKQTEWLKTSNPNKKDSKSFFCNFYLNTAVEPLNVKPWCNDYILHFNEIIRVKLIAQTKIYHKRDPMIVLINRSYTPRKSLEIPHLS